MNDAIFFLKRSGVVALACLALALSVAAEDSGNKEEEPTTVTDLQDLILDAPTTSPDGATFTWRDKNNRSLSGKTIILQILNGETWTTLGTFNGTNSGAIQRFLIDKDNKYRVMWVERGQ